VINFLKRCWQRRWLRGAALTLLTLFTLVALLWAVVDWSGAWHLREVKAMLAAKGQSFDLRDASPDPIPDSDNYCAIPLLKNLILASDGDGTTSGPARNRVRLQNATELLSTTWIPPKPGSSRGRNIAPPPKITGVQTGQLPDLNAWAAWLREKGLTANSGNAARDVLEDLSYGDSVFKELVAGLDRPEAQWTPAWKTRDLPRNLFSVALPHLTEAQRLTRTLSLRCAAAARAGDGLQAHECALISARLEDATIEEPFLIGMLVAAANAAHLADDIWELSGSQLGTAEDFRGLESRLAAMDFRQATWRSFSAELIAAVSTQQVIKEYPGILFGDFGQPEMQSHWVRNLAVRCIPSGFFDANSAYLANFEFVYLVEPLRDHGWQAGLDASHQAETALKELKGKAWTQPSSIMADLVAPTVHGVIHRAIYAQTLVNQAAIACALERSRIANGSYPDSLDHLTLADGKPLPVEVLSGKPMSYRKTPNGRYALWSASFDGIDHGGQRALDKSNPDGTRFWLESYKGDWVWDFPEK